MLKNLGQTYFTLMTYNMGIDLILLTSMCLCIAIILLITKLICRCW